MKRRNYNCSTKKSQHILDLMFSFFDINALFYSIRCVIYRRSELQQVVNGLLQRDDWDTAIKMPIGVIPAGTYCILLLMCICDSELNISVNA